MNRKIKELHKVVDEIATKVPNDRIELCRSLIDNSEVGIAIEIMLDEIYERDIEISKRSYTTMEDIAKRYIDDDYFDDIKVY